MEYLLKTLRLSLLLLSESVLASSSLPLASTSLRLSPQLPLQPQSDLARDPDSQSLLSAPSCPAGYNSCITSLSTCFNADSGASCPLGDACTSNHGCCPHGDLCTIDAAPASCASGDRAATRGDLCVPYGVVCCGVDGSYCYAGQTCVVGGGCIGSPRGMNAGGPNYVLRVLEENTESFMARRTNGNGIGKKDNNGDGDRAAVGVRANLALVAVFGVMITML